MHTENRHILLKHVKHTKTQMQTSRQRANSCPRRLIQLGELDVTLGEATAVPAASPGSRLGERSRSPSRSGSRYRGQVPQGAAGGSRRLGERGGSRRSTAPHRPPRSSPWRTQITPGGKGALVPRLCAGSGSSSWPLNRGGTLLFSCLYTLQHQVRAAAAPQAG